MDEFAALGIAEKRESQPPAPRAFAAEAAPDELAEMSALVLEQNERIRHLTHRVIELTTAPAPSRPAGLKEIAQFLAARLAHDPPSRFLPWDQLSKKERARFVQLAVLFREEFLVEYRR